MDRRIRKRIEAGRPYVIGQSLVPANTIPLQFQRPGLRQIAICHRGNLVCIYGQPYRIGRNYVQTHAVYYDTVAGATADEARRFNIRKIIWPDLQSGFDCIMMQDAEARLCGFVALPEGHPAHGWSCAELQATSNGAQFGSVSYSDVGTRHRKAMWSLAEDAQSVSSRMVSTRRDPKSFEHVVDLTLDRRWWFGFESSGAASWRPEQLSQFELPLPKSSSPPLEGEEATFLDTRWLAEALRRIDPKRRESDLRRNWI